MIEFKNIHIKYENNSVIKDFSIKLENDMSYALIGANGAGKSTLIKSLVGIVELSKGEISIDSLSVTKSNLSQIRKKVGIIFQRSDEQLFCPTVQDDILFGARNLNIAEEIAVKQMQNIARNLGIEDLLKRSTIRLSEGEKKLVAIAGVLIMNPDIILFDEADAMLDPRGKRQLASLINSLKKTKIIATHDLNFANITCANTILLNCGKLAKFAPTSQILQDTKLLEEYFMV